MRTRDFCTTPGDILAMCLSVVTIALTLKSWTNVYNYVSKAEGVPDLAVRLVLAACLLYCVQGWGSGHAILTAA